MPALPCGNILLHCRQAAAAHRPTTCCSPQVKYSVWLRTADSTDDLQVIHNISRYVPTSGHGWGLDPVNDSNGEPIGWDAFWADGSRFMHGGAARVRLALELSIAR